MSHPIRSNLVRWAPLLGGLLFFAGLLQADDLVGILPGSLSVDNKGAANYSAPLDLPAGRGGLAPSLAITYSSLGGSGPLGVGFSLSTGFPQAITRGRSILARDGLVKGVNFTSADHLYLDGKRLILISGEQGEPGSTYRTEVESFGTITAYGSGGNIEGFSLANKTGLTFYFGKNFNMSAVTETDAYQQLGGETTGRAYAWALKWVEDTVGNYVKLQYNQAGQIFGSGEHILTSLEYTGNRPGFVAPAFKIKFNYGQRPDHGISYRYGRSETFEALLQSIQIFEYAASTPFRSYNLTYKTDTQPVARRLGKLERSEASGGTVATTFQWGADAAPLQPLIASYGISRNPSFSGDFNADGRADTLLVLEQNNVQIQKIIYGGEDDDPLGKLKMASADFPLPYETYPTSRRQTTGDFNGDGRTDLVLYAYGLGSQDGGWYIALATDSGFSAPQRVSANHENRLDGDKVGYPDSAVTADLDGDGLDELIFQPKRPEFMSIPLREREDPTGLYGDPEEYTIFEMGPSESFAVMMPQLPFLIVSPKWTDGVLQYSETSLPNPWGQLNYDAHSLQPVDLNGDGRMDFVATAFSGELLNGVGASMGIEVDCLINQGNGASFTPGRTVFGNDDGMASHSYRLIDNTYVGEPNGGFHMMLGDVNGDGLDDIVVCKLPVAEGNVWTVGLSMGNGKFDFSSYGGIPASLSVDGTTVPTFLQRSGSITTDIIYIPGTEDSYNALDKVKGFEISGVLLLDYNGDGRKDFVWFSRSKGWQCLLAGGTSFDVNNPITIRGNPAEIPYTPTDSYFLYENDFFYEAVAADVDGNGRQDLVLQAPPPTLYGGRVWYCAFAPASDANRLVGATTALGGTDTIAYRAMTDPAIYTRGVAVQYPIREIITPTRVVADVYKDSGDSGNPAHFSYQYAGNRLDLSGRGSLGFQSFVTLDDQTGLFKYQFLTQSFPMTGLSVREQTYRYWGNNSSANFRLLSSHDNTVVFDEVMAGGSPTGTLYPFISRAIESRWEDSPTAHYNLSTTGASTASNPIFLNYSTAPPAGSHITISAQSLFDGQTDPQLTLPGNYMPGDTGRNQISVTPGNSAPQSTLTLTSSGSVTLGQPVTVAMTVTDPDNVSIGRHIYFKRPGSVIWEPWGFDDVEGSPGESSEDGPATPSVSSENVPATFTPDQPGVWQIGLVSYDRTGLNGTPRWGNESVVSITVTQSNTPIVAAILDIPLPVLINRPTGYAQWSAFSSLTFPRQITYGNLTKLSTDFGGGFTETVDTAYLAPVGALTGLVDNVTTTVVSPVGDSEVAPIKRYTYEGNSPLVKTEKIDATGTSLDLTTTYTRDTRGRVTNAQVSGYSTTGDYFVDDYSASSVTAFNDIFDLPSTTSNAAPYSHQTVTQYHAFLGKPTSVTDVNNAQITTTYDALGRATQQTDVLKNLTTNTAFKWTTPTGTDWTKSQTVTVPAGIVGLPGVTLTSAYAVRTTATVAPASTAYYDRLGRVIRTIKDGFGSQQTVTDAIYNKLGQTVATSLPYLQSASPTILWSMTTYDPLGRVVTITAPNGTVTTNTYAGRTTTVTVTPVVGTVQTTATLVDAKGRTVSVWNTDNIGGATPSIAFALDGFGRMRTTTLMGQAQTITATYDALGRQLTLNDPDKGLWTYVNNALGQVTRQTDAKSNVTTSTFDRLGRPLNRTTTSGTNTETADFYYYDTSTVTSTSQHTVIKGEKGWIGAPEREDCTTTGSYATTNLHYYDEKGRPSLNLSRTDGKWFYTYSDYDSYSRPRQVRHYWKPSGSEAPGTQPYLWQDFGYTYAYDSKSYLLSLTDSLGRSWWDTPSYDYMDRVTSVRKGGALTTTRTYRPEDGVLTALTTPGIQAMNFGFDGLGNLTSRADTGVSETLTYDNLNRLKTSKQGTTTYAPNGNILSKPDVTGAAITITAYDPNKPHAVTSVLFNNQTINISYDANGNLLTRQNTTTGETWNMKWAGFDKPRWMAKTTGSTTAGSEFHYNAARSRVLQLEFDAMDGAGPTHYNRKRTYAMGPTLELNYDNQASGSSQNWALKKVRIYVPGPDGIIGSREFDVISGTSGTEKALVYHYDHLGSITATTKYGLSAYALDGNGKPGKFSEDAWGQRRDPLSWNGQPTTTDDGGADSVTPRGYTGHEMLDDLGLVHMNGRIYDPLLGRFLSADTLVQAPWSLQSFNRYSYVMNNPLSLTDPSGFAAVAPPVPVTKAEMDAEMNAVRELFRKTPPRLRPLLALVLPLMLMKGDSYTPPQQPVVAPTPPDPNRPDPANPDKPQQPPAPHEVKIDEGAIQSNGQGDTVNPTQSPNQEAKPDAPKPEPKKDDSKSSSDAKDSKTAAADAASGDTPKLVDNPKHNPNSASPQPSNTKDLFSKSVVDKNGVRWAVDKDGTIHRFSKPSNGETHWNGSTAGDKPIKEQNIPNDIQKRLEEELKKLKEQK